MKAWYIRRIDHQESHFISCVLPTRSYYVTSHEVSASSAKALQFQQHSIAALFCRSCARAAKSWERRLFMSLWLVSFAQLKGLMLPATPYQTRWKATSTSLQCFLLAPSSWPWFLCCHRSVQLGFGVAPSKCSMLTSSHKRALQPHRRMISVQFVDSLRLKALGLGAQCVNDGDLILSNILFFSPTMGQHGMRQRNVR